MIECITVAITPTRITITAIGTDGTAQEVYERDAKGIAQPVDGNFEDEPIIDSDDLVVALCSLYAPAADAQAALQ
jgi:hypothetical protein